MQTTPYCVNLAGGYDVQGESGGKKTVGTLPTELAELSNWKYLLLEANNLQGNIPAEYSSLQSTETLWLREYQYCATNDVHIHCKFT